VVSLGYHGRTYGTMGMTTSGTIYRSGFFAAQNGVFVAPFPYTVNGPYGPTFESEHWQGERKLGNSSYWGSASPEIVARDSAR
jgi:4-aminobutyrate aminotransferase-like enzyme